MLQQQIRNAETDIHVDDPFSPDPPHGHNARWLVREVAGAERVIDGPMAYLDALRVPIWNDHEVVTRADQDHGPLVTGEAVVSRRDNGSAIDVTPALAHLEMQDFVDLGEDDFGPGDTTDRILGILRDQGDPRVERLLSSVERGGEAGSAAGVVHLQVDPDQIMTWLESCRPETHDEMRYRMDPPGPGLHD